MSAAPPPSGTPPRDGTGDHEPAGTAAGPRDAARVDPALPRWKALWRGLCPRCRVGRIFKGRISMNAVCPSCGLRFEREPGYFTGAMYFSYAFAVPILAALTLILWLGPMRRQELEWVVLVAGLLFIPFVPAVFRASRVVWIHMDRYVDPRP